MNHAAAEKSSNNLSATNHLSDLRPGVCMSLRPFIIHGAARTARTLASRCRPAHRLYATEAVQLAEVALKPTIYGQPLAPSHPHLCTLVGGYPVGDCR